ncbi:MAG: response regulator [Verrucomicrobiota bacterium JB024]|nr:response regulator [Verrucomicrobiota bacterium JB024]
MNQSVDPSQLTIILADDDVGHRLLIKRNLRRSNITNEILEFGDGESLIKFLMGCKEDPVQKNRRFLVMLDIRMPRMDGTRALAIIKQDPDLKRIPIIMLTTTEDPQEIERCHDLGCNSYVKKPIDHEQFINAIRQLGLYLSIVAVPSLK